MILTVDILLKADKRSARSIEKVETITRTLGLKPVSSGAGSVCCVIEDNKKDEVAELLNVTITEIPAKPRGAFDCGDAPGYEFDKEATIPEELSEFVESITVPPPVTYFA